MVLPINLPHSVNMRQDITLKSRLSAKLTEIPNIDIDKHLLVIRMRNLKNNVTCCLGFLGDRIT